MEKQSSESLYNGYVDELLNLDPGKKLRYGCYRLTICRKCLKLYGRAVRLFNDPVSGDHMSECLYQKCKCMEDEDKRSGKLVYHWNGFDFNIAAEFCHCCARELINSGSRFSPFYCDKCNNLVKEYNTWAGSAYIPFGRHTFLNGIRLELPFTDDEAREYEKSANEFLRRVDAVVQWQRLCLFENLHELGFDFMKDMDLSLVDALIGRDSRKRENLFRMMVLRLNELSQGQGL